MNILYEYILTNKLKYDNAIEYNNKIIHFEEYLERKKDGHFYDEKEIKSIIKIFNFYIYVLEKFSDTK